MSLANKRKKKLSQRLANSTLYLLAIVFLGYHLFPLAALGYTKIAKATSDASKLQKTIDEAQCIPGDGDYLELTYGNPLTDPLYVKRPYNDPAATAVTGTNLLPNPEMSGIDNGQIDRWEQNSYGNNDAKFSLQTKGRNNTNSTRLQITKYADGDAKWISSAVDVKPGEYLEFEEYYKSDASSDIVVETRDNGGALNYISLATLETSRNEWTVYRGYFVVPAYIEQIRIGHALSNTGTLETDDYKLVRSALPQFNRGLVTLSFDDGWRSIYENGMPLFDKYNIKTSQFIISGTVGDKSYMTPAMLDEFARKGHEIGSHSANHEDLSRLGDAAVVKTLATSRDVLNANYNWNANNFVSPYGRTTKMATSRVRECYQSMRGTATGYNTAKYDRYNLKVMNIEVNTKPEEIATAVRFARDHKLWLILLYHEVESDSKSEYAASIKDLEKHIQILKEEQVTVVTMEQGLVETQDQIK